MLLSKSLAMGFVIALSEVLNRNARVRFVHSRFGKKRAKLFSFLRELSSSMPFVG